jgi:hypothetical protein
LQDNTVILRSFDRSLAARDDSAEKRPFMLREPQHERKYIDDSNTPPFALNSSKGDRKGFSAESRDEARITFSLSEGQPESSNSNGGGVNL